MTGYSFRCGFDAVRRLCLAIVLMAPLSSLQAAFPNDAESLTSVQREVLESVVHDYLLRNPGVIRDAMAALQKQEEEQKQKQAALAIEWHRIDLLHDPVAPVGGNPNGDVSVVLFFDYQCGHCKHAAHELDALIAWDPEVRVVYKEFPILGPESLAATRAALAAQRQGKYVELHRLLMVAETISDNAIMTAAEKAGLDLVAMQRDVLDPAISELLERNYRLADALGINGTPFFIIGDGVIPGAASANTLAMRVRMERARQAQAATAAMQPEEVKH